MRFVGYRTTGPATSKPANSGEMAYTTSTLMPDFEVVFSKLLFAMKALPKRSSSGFMSRITKRGIHNVLLSVKLNRRASKGRISEPPSQYKQIQVIEILQQHDFLDARTLLSRSTCGLVGTAFWTLALARAAG